MKTFRDSLDNLLLHYNGVGNEEDRIQTQFITETLIAFDRALDAISKLYNEPEEIPEEPRIIMKEASK